MAGRQRAPRRKKGGPRMKQLGYHLVYVWLDPIELNAIRQRHPAEPLASVVRRLACEAVDHPYHLR
jgi:hypothetical protein